MTKTHFYLARHGETEWNCQRRLQGHLNSPLTEQGKWQARKLAQSLQHKSIDALICSPLHRALETAHIVQSILSLPITQMGQLKERHFGDWQGHWFDDLSSKPHFDDIFFRVTHHQPPNGESALKACCRFEKALRHLARHHINKSLLIITHGDVLRCFFSQLKATKFCDAYSQYGNGTSVCVAFCHTKNEFEWLPSTPDSKQ